MSIATLPASATTTLSCTLKITLNVTLNVTLKVTLNGDVHALPAGSTLADLIALAGHSPDALATAINSEFVPRIARATRVLLDGDAVFTFQAITGG